MEQRGFEIVEEGDWQDIVAFCSRLSDAICGVVSDEEYRRFEDWRPKPEESKHRLRKKSAGEAAIHKTEIEEKSQGTKQELANAGTEMRKSGEDIVKGHPRESLQDAGNAGSSAIRSLFPPLIRLFRSLEEILYVNVMERTSPSYFECADFTVALERELLDRTVYRARVIFEKQQALEHVTEELEEA